MKEIDGILLLKKVVMYDAEHDEYFINKKGVMVIYDIEGNNRVVDLALEKDITDITSLEVCLSKKKTRAKELFKRNKERIF